MRFRTCWLPITAFKNASKPYFLSLSPAAYEVSRHFNNISQKKFLCTCDCQQRRIECYDNDPSLFKTNLGFVLRSRFNDYTTLSRQFSINIPTVHDTTATTSSENGSGSDTKTRSRTLDQVVYHLQADIRRKRRIHRADIHNAIELVEEASKVDNFGPFLLNCCSDILPDLHPSYRVKLAERIWAVIQKGKEYTTAHFEAMLKALAVNEDKSLDPLKFLAEANSAGVNVNATMYFFAIFVVCQRGDLEAAVKILNSMKENTVPVNERFFNALMIGNLRSGDLKGATDMVDIMEASQIEPSIHTWNTLLHIYVETGNIKQLRKIYSENPLKLTEDQFYELLKAAGRLNNSEVIDLVIGWALESQKMHVLSLVSLSQQLMHLGHSQNALKIIIEFRNILRTKNEPLGAFFIKELQSSNTSANHETFLSLVTSLQGENRNPYALNMAAELCLKHKKFDLAYKIFSSMLSMKIPVRPHYFLPVFVSETKDNGVIGGVKVLGQMKALNVQPDWEMLLNWIIPNFSSEDTNLSETLKIIKEVTGLTYSSGGLISAGLFFALQEKKLQEGIMLVEKLKGKVSNPGIIMEKLFQYTCDCDSDKNELTSVTKFLKYVSECKPLQDKEDHVGSFIVKLMEADRIEETELVLKDIIKLQIPVSETAAEIIKEKINLDFQDELEVDTTMTFQHYNNGLGKHMIRGGETDVTSLECHKQELESKGMNARGTSRKLFLKYCATENLEKVLQAKDCFEKEFGNISRGMKSALLGAYTRHEVLESALELFQELTGVTESVSDVVVDVYKIIDLATLMVKKGMVEDAVLLLQDKCPTRKINRPENISRNIVNLLEAVSKSNAEYVYELTQLFLKSRFIKPTNPTLAPSIRDLIRRQDLEGAVDRFEQYAEKYAMNPCLQELTYAVLETPNLLERVLKCSTEVKGEREAKRLLALAKSDVGDIDGAAKILMELGNELSFVSLLKQCEYLSSRNEIERVLNLISAISKTGKNYDCKKLYDIAIQACKRSGNKDGLKQLLSHMEEQDLYISPKLKLLVNSI